MERVLLVFVTATNMQISLAHKLVSNEPLALSKSCLTANYQPKSSNYQPKSCLTANYQPNSGFSLNPYTCLMNMTTNGPSQQSCESLNSPPSIAATLVSDSSPPRWL